MVGERALDAKLLVVTLPHFNARYCTPMLSERSECLRDGLREVFEWIGRAPSSLVLDNATSTSVREPLSCRTNQQTPCVQCIRTMDAAVSPAPSTTGMEKSVPITALSF